MPILSGTSDVRKIGYARVSSSDQSPEMQIEALKRYGVPPGLIFVDKASGGTMERPAFKRAMTAAQHEGSEFVVWKLDRLGRTLGGVLEALQILTDKGIAFVSLTERLDTTSPMGKAMVHLLVVFAELERDLIIERTRAGIQRAQERGQAPGRPKGMTDERIAKAREMLAAGDRGETVWKALRKMPGPNLSRSPYYAWQQLYDVETRNADLKD